MSNSDFGRRPRAIAVIAWSGCFPGANSPEEFWQNLVNARDASSDTPPAGRWVLDPGSEPLLASFPAEADKVASTRAYFLRSDPTAGGGPDAQLLEGEALLDPLCQLALHVGRRAWSNAGCPLPSDPTRAGVILANIALPTDSISDLAREAAAGPVQQAVAEHLGVPIEPGVSPCATPGGPGDIHPTARAVAGLPAGLLASALGVQGGAYTLDAACASSLYAIELAALELEAGRADVMISGGMSRPDSLYTQMGFSQLRALSAKGRCAPFDASADGLMVGEGAAFFVLKRLDDAIAAGDPIHAVIRGIGLSNDVGGKLLAPDSEGQLRAMNIAYQQAGWQAQDVDMIECHGTGTPRGDATELTSLRTLWEASGSNVAAAPRCAVGSVKANVGHLLTGAGAAALSKVLLALKHETIPPQPNFTQAASDSPLQGSPFFVPVAPVSWKRREALTPRRAAVSGFGFGGINAHLLLEEWLPQSESNLAGPAIHVTEPPEPVAIVGMEACFGPLATLRDFQTAHFHGTSAIRENPPASRARSIQLASGAGKSGTSHVSGQAQHLQPKDVALARGAYLPDLAIHAGEFRIPPVELTDILPQQLLMLRVAKAALQDAVGEAGAQRKLRTRAGVICGMSLDLGTTNFHLRWTAERLVRRALAELGIQLAGNELAALVAAVRERLSPPLTATRTLGALGGIIASRIARELDLGGASFTISSEESSGLRAVEVATRLLQAERLDLAIAGAVDLPLDWRCIFARETLTAQQQHVAQSAYGDGAGAVVLKRLSDAQRNGDRIYAVLRGIGCANASGPIANAFPAFKGAAASLSHACRRAGQDVPGAMPGLWETSGQADSLVTELQQLPERSNAFQPCALSTAHAVAGDCGAAHGMVSLLRAVLALHTATLPAQTVVDCSLAPQGHAMSLASASEGLNEETWHIPRQALPWIRDRVDGPRIAAVSSLGSDGTALHALLEEAPAVTSATRAPALRQSDRFYPLAPAPHASREALFPVAGKDVREISRQLDVLLTWAKANCEAKGAAVTDEDRGSDAELLEGFARQWVGEHAGDCLAESPSVLRLAILAGSVDELRRRVADAATQFRTASARLPQAMDGRKGIFFSPEPMAPQGQTAFLFPGSCNHYLGMGQGYALRFPQVLDSLDADNQRLASQSMPRWLAPWRLSWPADWEAQSAAALLDDQHRMIFGQVTHGVVVHDVLRLFLPQPDAVIGYSLGETASLFSTRTWRGRDELLRRMQATDLFRTQLGGTYEAARRHLRWPRDMEIDWQAAVVNRPAEAVRAVLDDPARRDEFRAVFLLIVNAPEECVLGGHWPDVQRAVAAMGGRAWPLSGISIAHCAVVQEVADQYRDLHRLPVTPPQGMRIYSGNLAAPYEATTENCANSVLRHALYGFDYPAVINRAWDDGIRIFVEPGPQGSCTRAVGRILRDKPHVAVTACVRGQDDWASLLRVLGRLFAEGVPVRFDALYPVVHKKLASPAKDGRTILVPIELPAIRLEAGTWHVPGQTQAPVPEYDGHELLAQESAPQASSFAAVTIVSPLVQDVAETFAAQPVAISTTTQMIRQESSPLVSTTRFQLQEVLGGAESATLQVSQATGDAHASFLALSQTTNGAMSAAIEFQLKLMESAGLASFVPGGVEQSPAVYSRQGHDMSLHDEPLSTHAQVSFSQADLPHYQQDPATPPRALNRAACLEFAIGSISRVLGPLYAEADNVPNRVRLPDEPLMLVDRITDIQGEPLSLGSGMVVTEHDVLPGAWYLDAGCAPVCISVEAGQADLFLSGYLGIDLATRGERRYRLLDARIAFHRHLPRPGETIRYEIHIDKFIQQGNTWLFFFRFDGFIGTEPLLTMRDGCAGFFSQQQLDNSAGIVLTPEEANPGSRTLPSDWLRLVSTPVAATTYSASQLEALRHGNLAGAFGPEFANLPLRQASGLPGGRMTLIHRVTALDPRGGRYGLGSITAEADVKPDDWYLTCHFIDDMVMPGTLMYECCLHTLRVYLMRLGWVGEEGAVTYEPVPGRASKLRCRGQVLQSTRVVRYEIELKELGYAPGTGQPYAIADAFMYSDGRRIVFMSDMSLRLNGLTRNGLAAMWAGQARAAAGTYGVPSADASPAVYTQQQILQYAIGEPSQGFGEPYRIFDHGTGRVLARLPGPPYLFVDRVTQTHGARAWELAAGAWIEAQYDVPRDAWYFWANRQKSMALSVLLEIALQPCGWLAAFLGSALRSPEMDLHFRNLGGTAVQLREILPGSGELTTQVKLTSFSEAGGMIIQKYDMCVWQGGEPVYKGDTSFGFFSKAALAQQVGVRGARERQWKPTAEALASALALEIAPEAPLTPEDAEVLARQDVAEGHALSPGHVMSLGMHLPARAYRMVESAQFIADGGPHGLGYIRGEAAVDPGAWFFKAHFYQDPVWPGSLGLESMLQLLKLAARQLWPQLIATQRFTPIGIGRPHTWAYRGQIIPRNKRVCVDAVITKQEFDPASGTAMLTADGFLEVDGIIIYEMTGFTLGLTT